MEFSFDVQRLFGGEPIAVLNAKIIHRLKHGYNAQLTEVIDSMGRASQRAQGLSAILTCVAKLQHSENTLFVVSDRRKCLGMIKVGRKKLFIRNERGAIAEIEPLCVLDFYVHESCQRTGVGKRLFEYMLAHNRTTPANLGYDRPSHKFLSFLSRHYGLKDYVPQTNNFVVFKAYFDRNRSDTRSTRGTIAERPLTGSRGGGGAGFADSGTAAGSGSDYFGVRTDGHGGLSSASTSGHGRSGSRGRGGAFGAAGGEPPFGTDPGAGASWERGPPRHGRRSGSGRSLGGGSSGDLTGAGVAAGAAAAGHESAGAALYGGGGAGAASTYGHGPTVGVGRAGSVGAAASDEAVPSHLHAAPESFVPGLGSEAATTYSAAASATAGGGGGGASAGGSYAYRGAGGASLSATAPRAAALPYATHDDSGAGAAASAASGGSVAGLRPRDPAAALPPYHERVGASSASSYPAGGGPAASRPAPGGGGVGAPPVPMPKPGTSGYLLDRNATGDRVVAAQRGIDVRSHYSSTLLTRPF